MNPILHLSDLCEQLREAENRHKSTCNDYRLFMRRSQSLRRRTYLLHFKVLECRKKIMNSAQASKESGDPVIPQAVSFYDEAPNSEKHTNATVSEIESSISSQREHRKSFAHEETEIGAPLLGEEESLRRNTSKVKENISSKVEKEVVQCESLDKEPSDFSNGIIEHQLAQEAEGGYSSNGVLKLTKFPETNRTASELPESPSKLNVLKADCSPLSPSSSTLSPQDKISKYFPLSKINGQLSEHNSSEKSFPKTSRYVDNLEKTQENDNCSNDENTTLLPENRANYSEMKTFKNMRKLVDEYGNESSSRTEIPELKECSEASPPEQNMYTKNHISPRTGNFIELEKSTSNNPVPLVPEIIVMHSPYNVSDENLSCHPKYSSVESFKKLEDGFWEIPLKQNEQQHEEYFEEEAKPLCFKAANAYISKESHQEFLLEGFESSELKEYKGVSQRFAKTEDDTQTFEPISSKCMSAEKILLQGSTSTGSNTRGRVFKCCSRSDTDISFMYATRVSPAPRYRSLEVLKTSYETNKSNSYALFNLVNYNPRHYDLVRATSPDYYHAVDDQQVLLPSRRIFEKNRKCFHFKWKPFGKIKRKSKFSRQSRDIFASKSQEDIRLTRRKVNLFVRIFRPLINCGNRVANRPLANDLVEVLDTLEE